MELWNTWECPYCMRVRAALAEKGVPYRSRDLGPAAAATEVAGKDPRGTLPRLIDGTTIVEGALPVLEYLCSRWPEPPLIPPRIGRPAVVAAYERVDALFAPHLPRIDRGRPEERVQALGEVRRSMAELDAQLVSPDALLGEFSIADLAIASFLAKLPRDWRPTQLGFERLGRWEKSVMRRPSVREHMGPRMALAS
jgi:glutathione S-transferase